MQDTAIVIRTYRGDRDWMRAAMITLRRRAKGFREIVVALTAMDRPHFSDADLEGARVVVVENDRCRGYLAQQITKLYADDLTAAEYILFSDSDTLATREFTPDEFFTNEKPIYLLRQWANVGAAIMWKEPTETALGIRADYEFMATLPLLYRRDTLRLCREKIAHSARQYIEGLGNNSFSEFNALGATAYELQRDLYDWREANPETDGYPRPLKQFWSHGGFEQAKPEIEALLA